MRLELIESKERWDEIVGHFDQRDFYHSYTYHDSRREAMEAEPILVVYFDDQSPVFAMPFLRRKIDDFSFDLVSVYGYSGPLCNNIKLARITLERIADDLGPRGCVSIFCRLHPIIHESLEGQSFVFDCGRTVLLPCVPEDERFPMYRQTTRSEIRKLNRNQDAEVRFNTTEESFNAFFEIYYQTMRGLGADDFYFFDEEFIRSIFEIESTTATIGTVHYQGEIVSTAIFTACGEIGQYFLGGAKREFSKLAPQKLLLHKACDWAIKQGVSGLHLGGGRGSREDSLFKFKSGFSKTFLPFRVIKMVTNPEKYDQLTAEFETSNGAKCDTGFFPAYRSPVSIK